MKAEFKDTTSYSRGERGSVEPRSWTLDVDKYRLTISRHRQYPKDKWLLFDNLFIDQIELDSKDVEHAKREGMVYAANYYGNISESLWELMND